MLFFHATVYAQDLLPADTLAGSDSVEVTSAAFGTVQRSLSSAAVVRTRSNQLEGFSPASLLPAMNTIAGVRMEERSPGSYRLNIRGSSLRSPFGVRNVKMYWNDIPFTDAGGNTYFNQLATNSMQAMHIVRGPAGSMYGAGTGGLVLIQSVPYTLQPGFEVQYSYGSFGTQGLLADASFGNKEHKNHMSYAYNETDGYRNQSAMRRHNAAFTSRFAASDKQQLTVSLLYTHLDYETPGGLTLAEYEANPRAARPATPGFPSAEQAKAGIVQQNFLAGISNRQKLGSRWTNTTALYGAFALVDNAAIRNYESRSEPHLGGRTVFAFEKKKDNTSIKWQTGAEYQAGFFNTQVSRNKNGNRDSLLTNDDLQFNTGFLFTQADLAFSNKLFVLAGVSVNGNKVAISRLSSLPVQTQERSYRNEWAPRLQLTWRWPNDMETQATYSRGFSPPTVGELLPSTGRISTDLEAERGNNYELAQSMYLLRKKLRIDITAFYLQLNNTLVQQRDAGGADYFINAGSSIQQGIESSLSYVQPMKYKSLLQNIQATAAYTFSHFTYEEYKKLGTDYSGKRLPGVPRHAASMLALINGRKGWYMNLSWYFNSAIMLNDANSFQAGSFHLLGAKLGYRFALQQRWQLHVFAGADNLLNERYSLGNDINAAGNRFYNAAPTRNVYGGLALRHR